jgi:peptide chain release factor subunit 1
LAGLAEFKLDLNQSDMFDQRLAKIVIKTVDTSYGFENGFNQAIEASKETLKNVKFVQEKALISKFFEEIAMDTRKYCYGIRDVLYAIDSSAVLTLIVFENLDLNRIVVGTSTGDKVLYLTPSQEKNSSHFKDPETNADLEIKEKTAYVDWLAEHYKGMGFSLQFVTDSSQEGSQFVKGFGGIGCLLRFVVDFSQLDAQEEADEGKEREADSYDDDADYDYIY